MTIATIDFETYSEAGYNWDTSRNRWQSVVDTAPHSIGAVGAPVYAEHPSTDVLCLAYDLMQGDGPQLWIPGMWMPEDLLGYAAFGGLIEAHNSMFEYLIWNHVCTRRYGWLPLQLRQLRCSAAKCRAASIPGKLATAAQVLRVADQKIGDGSRLIDKFSKPHNPTRAQPARRIHPGDDPVDAANLYLYCMQDIRAERAVSEAVPELTPEELEVWLVDQEINARGVYIDQEALANCISIIDQAHTRYTEELRAITGGAVQTANEIKNMTTWLNAHGANASSLTAESVEYLLTQPLPAEAHRVLEIRQILGSASVKKLYAIERRVSSDGRLRDLFSYGGALHTRRWSGKGPQPQNIPANVPNAHKDDEGTKAMDEAFEAIATRDLAFVEWAYGDPVDTVLKCLRGLFCAAPGYDLICSDYKAIEAVVLAELAGETWRQEVFAGHGMIYEMSASKISGVPFIEFARYKKEHGEHHPLRKKIGKVAELASGFGGGLGAWKAFGADKHLTDDEIKAAIAAWRRESPMIVKFWYAVENCAIAAIQHPGQCYEYRGIGFGVRNDILHIKLPSGRLLNYHEPRLRAAVTPWGSECLKISFMGWNSRPGTPPGWMRMDIWYGILVENIVQATSRDILAHALVGLEHSGYRPVLHVHDEPCGEVPEGWGSVEEFERIMTTLPAWARGWPVKAVGGWRGKRYRKE